MINNYTFFVVYGSSGGSCGNIDYFFYKIENNCAYEVYVKEYLVKDTIFKIDIAKFKSYYAVRLYGNEYGYSLSYDIDMDMFDVELMARGKIIIASGGEGIARHTIVRKFLPFL